MLEQLKKEVLKANLELMKKIWLSIPGVMLAE